MKARLRPDSALQRQLADHGRCYKCHLKPPCVHFSSLKKLEDSVAPANRAEGARDGSLVEHGGDEAEDTVKPGRSRPGRSGGPHDSQLTPHRPQMASPAASAKDREDQGPPPLQLKRQIFSKDLQRQPLRGQRRPAGSPLHDRQKLSVLSKV